MLLYIVLVWKVELGDRFWAGGLLKPRLLDRAGFEPYRPALCYQGLARDLPHAKRALMGGLEALPAELPALFSESSLSLFKDKR